MSIDEMIAKIKELQIESADMWELNAQQVESGEDDSYSYDEAYDLDRDIDGLKYEIAKALGLSVRFYDGKDFIGDELMSTVIDRLYNL